MLCRYLCLHGYFNLSRKKLQGGFREKSVKTDFSAFLSTFPRLVDFSGYFWILAVFDKNHSFLHHGQDLLKFEFFLNLTADFGANSFKKLGGVQKVLF